MNIEELERLIASATNGRALVVLPANAAPALLAAAKAVLAYDAADQLGRAATDDDDVDAALRAWHKAEALIGAAVKQIREA
jgi:hypothetical protein